MNRSTMKLLPICSVSCMLVLVQVVLVVARPGTETVETESVDLSNARKLGKKAYKIAEEILSMMGTVPGLNLLSEYGETALEDAAELGKQSIQLIKNIPKKQKKLIDKWTETGRNVLNNVTETGVRMTQQLAATGKDLARSGVESAQSFTKLIKDRINGFTSIADMFTESLHKIIKLLDDVGQLMRNRFE